MYVRQSYNKQQKEQKGRMHHMWGQDGAKGAFFQPPLIN
jgi:hypothetical protein